jgi:hypothetical protein
MKVKKIILNTQEFNFIDKFCNRRNLPKGQGYRLLFVALLDEYKRERNKEIKRLNEKIEELRHNTI